MEVSVVSRSDHPLDKIFKPFFDANPTSMLIRGMAGTGKTTMALELLNYKREYNGYYISTRVSHQKITQHIPWVRDLLKGESVLTPWSTSDKAPMIDVRLGTASIVLELVMRATMKKNAFIILDSWDALAKETDQKERLKIEKTMVSIADSNNSFIVFISEEPELNTVSYLVDGVVTLENYASNGMQVRCLTLDKMRGMPINYKRIFYTLLDSHFNAIYRSNSIFNIANKKLFEPIRSKANYVSSGNMNMDKVLGSGLKRGSVVTIEVNPNTDRRFLGLLLSSAVLNNIRNERPAMIVNTPDKPYKSILGHIEPYCSSEDLNKLVILTQEVQMGERDLQNPTAVVPFSDDNIDDNYNKFMEMYYMFKTRYNDSIMITYDIGLTEIYVSEEILKQIMQKVLVSNQIFRRNGDVSLLINRSGSKSMILTQSIADVHLRMWNDEGVTMLQALKPFNGIYAMVSDTHNGYPSYELKRMI